MSFDELMRQSTTGEGDYVKLEDYYNGRARLDALGVNLPPKVRLLELIAPFPKMAVDVLAEVLTPEGYLLTGGEDVVGRLRSWWQSNDLDTVFRLAATEALVQGRVYWIVSPTEKFPRVTAHSMLGMAVSWDPMGGVAEALRKYRFGGQSFACHYLPGVNRYYRKHGGAWIVDREVQTGASVPAVVPMLNRQRLYDQLGRSEITEIAKITDAASRSLTNLQVAQELLSMPLRFIFGRGATENLADTEDKKIATYFGNLITGPEGTKAEQLAGADLTSIINSYKLYAQQISAMTGIPPSMLGISTDNPSSAEAMRVAKERLITRAEVKQSMFGDALEQVARLELEMMGEPVDGLETLEMQWRDPATPSQSAQMANALQAHAQGVISDETTRDFMRLTPEQKQREIEKSRELRDMTG